MLLFCRGGNAQITRIQAIDYKGKLYNIGVDIQNHDKDSFYANNMLVGGMYMQEKMDK